jgi:hypothetical protein
MHRKKMPTKTKLRVYEIIAIIIFLERGQKIAVRNFYLHIPFCNAF